MPKRHEATAHTEPATTGAPRPKVIARNGVSIPAASAESRTQDRAAHGPGTRPDRGVPSSEDPRPYTRARHDEFGGVIETGERPRLAAARPRPCGILVVEADPDVQWRLARSLTVEGNRVVGTSSGEGALALVEQWAVDVVVVAEDLPGMDGLEVIRRLHGHCPELQSILMANAEPGSALLELELAARLAGAIAVVRKPFSVDQMKTLFLGLALPTSIRPPVARPPRPPVDRDDAADLDDPAAAEE